MSYIFNDGSFSEECVSFFLKRFRMNNLDI